MNELNPMEVLDMETEQQTALAPPDLSVDLEDAPMVLRLAQANVPPDVIKQYMEIDERSEDRKARKAFAQAMHRVQQAMPAVVKDKHNSHTNSEYASLESVLKKAKPVYVAEGFSVNVDEDTEYAREGWVRVRASVTHRDGHKETYYRAGPVDNKGAKGAATKTELHGCQSTVSYLRRALECSIWNIILADEDDDGNGGGSEFITEEQHTYLASIINKIGRDNMKMDVFLSIYGADDLATIPFDRYEQAKSALNRKLDEVRKAAEGGAA